ncbi:iron-sulfur cluster transfer protein NUBPL [Diachasmimorpha longicaudata]|uniref:iron-sulfur cluster transfer protein NUBPL n=1 Tax=Diachasmimorpha longicaudata TaxID=58733 RepID=UPI0030B8B932
MLKLQKLLEHSEKMCRKISLCQVLSKPDKFDTANKERKREIMAKGLPKQKPIEGVKQILIVASAKGGVGKSTTSVNLATAMKAVMPEKQVGLLDADVFGPTIPLMMNLHHEPFVNDQGLMVPLVNYGVKCMSMGFLVNQKTPMIWRGLMVMSALEKLLRQVAWGPLDYLIVDTPPGTGDTLLSLIQNIPVSGVLIITTPHKAASKVTRRGAEMFQKLDVPVVGLVENMSSISCPKCTHEILFPGTGGVELAEELGLKFLKRIPLHESISLGGDVGTPIVASSPDCRQSKLYKSLAQDVIDFLQNE